LSQFVEASATALQVPADMTAMLSLASVAACCAGRFKVQVKPGYIEPTNIYTLVVLDPGNRKSAAFSLATAPLEEFERQQVQRMHSTLLERVTEQAVLKKSMQHAQGKAARTMDPEERASWLERSKDLAAQLGLCMSAGDPRLLADDVTPQRLASLLAENGGRIAVMSSEGGLFNRLASQAALDIVLKGHAGDQIRIDRITRGPEFIESPAVTVALTVQQEVLRGLTDRPGFRGRGLLARFLYAMPRSPVGQRDVDPPPVPTEVKETYRAKLHRLLALDGGQKILQLSPEGLEAWLDFARTLEPRLAEHGDLAPITDWGSKLAGACARLAGLLHIAEHMEQAAGEPVFGATVQAATQIADYLTAHAKAAFGEMGADRALEDARRVVGWLERIGAPTVTAREVFQATKGRLGSMARLRPVLALLEEHGYIRRIEVPRPRGPGRPSQHFAVNPVLVGVQETVFEDSGDFVGEVASDDHGSNGSGRRRATYTSVRVPESTSTAA